MIARIRGLLTVEVVLMAALFVVFAIALRVRFP